MAAPKLTEDQREALLTWLAAEYDTRLIRQWFKANKWPEIDRAMFTYYRKKYGVEIDALRVERRAQALNSGLALKEERLARLTRHADELEAIKWVPDKNGRMWNEKAWRETLDDIAKEMGHRRQGIDIALQEELDYVLERLQQALPPEQFALALAALRGGETGSGEA